MSLFGITATALALCMALPMLAVYALHAVPLLVSLLFFIAVVRLVRTPRSGRR